ncbi:28628_t:CDS:2, partial [Racocetra persica]
MLPLQSRKQLSGQILKKSTVEISKTILDDVINDDLGVVLVYDGWKNIAHGKRSKSDAVIEETKKAFDYLKQKNIKVNRLITDPASKH